MPNTKSAFQPYLLAKYQKATVYVAIGIIIIFHAVGIWGMAWSGNPNFYLRLTPLNLLLTNLLLFGFHRDWNLSFIVFAIVTLLVGFFAEVLGVHTGLLFGNYSYGSTLGYKVFEVPLLIGLNWLLLTYVTGMISHKIKAQVIYRAAIGAILMLLLDFFIEPVAIRFDFWTWETLEVPLSNYAGWFGLAFLLQLYFHKSSFYKYNPMAIAVYLVQLLFFILLNALIEF